MLRKLILCLCAATLSNLAMNPLQAQDRRNIREIGAFDTEGWSYDVKVVGNYALVADNDRGLAVFNISAPADPRLVAYNQYGARETDITVAGQIACLAEADRGIRILNIADPRRPRVLSEFDTPGEALGTAIEEGTLYVADGNDGGLRIVDISDPGQPREIGFYDTPGYAHDVCIRGELAYIADYRMGLRIIDVSDPEHPQEVGHYDTPIAAYGVDVVDEIAYVAEASGVYLIDVSDPRNPRLISRWPQPWSRSRRVTVQGSYAYVASAEAGLRMLDVSDPENVRQVGFFDTPDYACDLTISGGLVFVADGASGLRIYDCTNPAIAVTPGSLDFGYVDVGSTQTLTLNIQNTGTADLTIYNVVVEGDACNVDFEDEVVLAPDDSCEVNVSFSPAEDRCYRAQIAIDSDDLDREVVGISLGGIGFLHGNLYLQEDFNYPIDPERFRLFGNAAQDPNWGGWIRLTDNGWDRSGSIFCTRPLEIRSFSAVFTIWFGNGSDGMTFAMAQNMGLGGGGGGLGYYYWGLGGYCIEFDTWRNDNEPNDNHIALVRNDGQVIEYNSDLPELNNQHDYYVRVDFDNGHVEVYLACPAINFAEQLVLETTIEDFQPYFGHFGFTAANGGGTGDFWVSNLYSTIRGLPAITVDPEVVESQIEIDQSNELGALNILNDGERPLFYRITPEIMTGVQRGFWGQYYNNPRDQVPEQLGDLVFERIDEVVGFDWGGGSPGDGVNGDFFGARWTSHFFAPQNGDHYFGISHDGFRLFVDDEVVISRWENRAAWDEARIELAAGWHEIKMELFECWGGAGAWLYWLTPYFRSWDYVRGYVQRPWLTVDPATGVIGSGTDADVIISVDAARVEAGPQHAELHITTSDPANPTVVVGVDLLVLGREDLVAEPDQINEALSPGGMAELPVNLANVGQEVLNYAADVPTTPQGFRGQYYHVDPDHWFDTPFDEFIMERIDQTIDFDWGWGSPGGVRGDWFTVRWTAFFFVPEAGRYEFQTYSDDGVRLNINDEIVLNDWQGHGWEWYGDYIDLESGWHRLVLEYLEHTGPAGCRLYWRRPGEQDFHIMQDAARCQPQWLYVEPMTAELGGEVDRDLFVTLDARWLEIGNYAANIHLEVNERHSYDVDIPVLLQVRVAGGQELQHFNDFVQTDVNHSLLITELAIADQPAPTGCEVGVFTPGDILSGGGIWVEGDRLGLAAWGDDQQTEDVVEGFQADERIFYRVWDNQADEEYAAVPEYIAGPDIWSSGGFSACNLTVSFAREMELSLRQGWNLMSINVTPPRDLWVQDEGPDIVRMTERLRIDARNHHLLLMKDEQGRFYSPAFRFNNIPYWNLAEGYATKLDQDVEVSWSGEPIPPDADIPISRGWNMIAYFPTYQLTCARPDFFAIAPILQNVVLVKDAQGRFTVPSLNFSNMPPWREGQGYQINVNAAVVLNYLSERGQAASLTPDPEVTVKRHWVEPAATGRNMSVLLTVTPPYPPLQSRGGAGGVESGDQVAAFSASGALVGVGTVSDGMCGLAVWGDDPSTEAVDGLAEGEAFELKLWDADKDVVVGLGATGIQEGAGLVYTTDAFTALVAAAKGSIPVAYYLGQNYPNPFNAVTRLSFGLPQGSRVTIRVFDVAGRVAATLVSGELRAGHHSVVWNGEGMTSGIYLMRMEASGFTATRKVMLVK